MRAASSSRCVRRGRRLAHAALRRVKRLIRRVASDRCWPDRDMAAIDSHATFARFHSRRSQPQNRTFYLVPHASSQRSDPERWNR